MMAQGKTSRHAARVDALLRTPDSAPWRTAPVELHDNVMASLDSAAVESGKPVQRSVGQWRVAAIAACVAITAGGLGLLIGASAWRSIPATPTMVVADASSGTDLKSAEAPTVLLARAFEDLSPAGSSRLVASVAAPMRSEAQGLVTETRHAARTILSRLPFVSMD